MLKRSLTNRISVNLRYYLPWALSDFYFGLTGNKRKLPEFLIIGSAKGGTTSLFDLLSQHPDCELSRRKETNYLTNEPFPNERHYRGFFNLKNSASLTGEASTYYMYHPHVPKRANELVPNAKLIVMLRNPAERALSHYNMMKGLDDAPDFDTACEWENERVVRLHDKAVESKRIHNDHQAFSYLSRGFYHRQLQVWLKYYPVSQFLFIKSEEFFEDPQHELDRVHEFLGLRDHQPADLKPKNAKTYDKLEKEHRAKLLKLYEEDMSALKGLLGEKFYWSENEG